MKCLKEKCIHSAVCALYTCSGYASDECGFYETRPQGEWRHYEGYLTCSECRTEYDDDIMMHCGDDVPNFCPNCGADMREGEAE